MTGIEYMESMGFLRKLRMQLEAGEGVEPSPELIASLRKVELLIDKVELEFSDEDKPANTVGSAASSMAIAIMGEQLRKGGTIEIPSLGIVISSENEPSQQ